MNGGPCPRLMAILALLAGWLSGGALADTYRWTDERGATNYSDRVPPEQAKNRRARLSPQGFEVEVIEAPKTREQIQREQLLKQLRSQQEKVLNEQRDQDKALMKTYRSTDEILTALKLKLDNLESAVKLTQASIDRDQITLTQQEQRAHDSEARRQPVPSATRDAITALNRRMSTYRAQIHRLENEKLATADQFQRDLKRFQAIKAMQDRNENLNADWTRAVNKIGLDSKNDLIISAVECAEKVLCDRYWVLAKDYLTRKSGYPISVETDKILQTPYPRNDTDFGITITRIAGKPDYVIFMDVICRPTSIGEQLCKSNRIREVHSLFNATMLGAYPTAEPSSGYTDAGSSLLP